MDELSKYDSRYRSNNTTLNPLTDPKEDIDVVPEESRVGKRLSDLTQRRVIILVLAMLFSIPATQVQTYIIQTDSYSFGLEVLAAYPTESPAFLESFEAFRDSQEDANSPLILL